MGALVLRRRVVPPLARRARESDDLAHRLPRDLRGDAGAHRPTPLPDRKQQLLLHRHRRDPLSRPRHAVPHPLHRPPRSPRALHRHTRPPPRSPRPPRPPPPRAPPAPPPPSPPPSSKKYPRSASKTAGRSPASASECSCPPPPSASRCTPPPYCPPASPSPLAPTRRPP